MLYGNGVCITVPFLCFMPWTIAQARFSRELQKPCHFHECQPIGEKLKISIRGWHVRPPIQGQPDLDPIPSYFLKELVLLVLSTLFLSGFSLIKKKKKKKKKKESLYVIPKCLGMRFSKDNDIFPHNHNASITQETVVDTTK